MVITGYKSENYNEYSEYLKSIGDDNSAAYSLLKRNLLRAIKDELTEKQWESLKLYYIDGIKMPGIASILGVNTSTVSRNIKRGRDKLKRCLKYGARELLNNCGE